MKKIIYPFVENYLPALNVWGAKIFFDFIGFRAFLNNHPVFEDEFELNKIMQQLVTKYQTEIFIDIGSNVGIHGISMAKRNPKIEIKNVEPNPRLIKLQKKSIKKNQIKNIELFGIALSDNEEDSILFMNNASTGESSLIELNHLKNQSKIRVQTNRLDNIFKSKNSYCVKIDVEGNELKGLLGAVNLLKYIKWLVVESSELNSPEDTVKVLELLKLNGFKEIQFNTISRANKVFEKK